MKTSAKGRALIEQREGVRLKAYRDTRGILTIGVGHTSAAGAPIVTTGLVLTQSAVDQILSRDLGPVEAAINRSVHVPLTDHQFDACASLAFNIGWPSFETSTVVHDLNAQNLHGAADAFLMWDHPAELMGRRRAEREQFLTPYA